MAKNKDERTPHYEMLYIVANKYTEEELKPIQEKTKKVVQSRGGRITYGEEWGLRKLAYPVDKFSHGYYQLLEFDLEPDKLEALNRELRLSNEVLRHIIVGKEAKTAEEIRREKERIQARAEKARQKPEPKASREKEEKEDKKVDLKDLDEKLDKILDTDDLL